ncbi:hypothetical protein N9U81_00780 [Candidatus Pelagibacter sp.]|nr:hypothetical protein [Candidatus Pelagibacter sp.]|tara:strand:- start:1441 stop:1899 length:459 start_codon:yes stop_codon:yes gene_type:complete
MKNIILLIILISLSSCSGYKPILTSKDINFNILDIKVNENDRISNNIKKKLKIYSDQEQKENTISLEINSVKQVYAIAKDSKGDDSVYEMRIITNIEIINLDTDNNKVKFEEKFSFNNQSNKFELEQYKKDIQNDLIDKIVEKLILNLRTTK